MLIRTHDEPRVTRYFGAAMITNERGVTREEWLFPAMLGLVILLLACLGESGREWLRFDHGAIDAGQYWRVWSGHLVHAGWYHLLLNGLGLIILVLLCPERVRLSWWTVRFVLMAALTSAGLYWFGGGIEWYVGLSGLMHGYYLLGLRRPAMQRDWIAIACLAYLVGKLVWEEWVGIAVSNEAAIGVPVATRSHLFGALSALPLIGLEMLLPDRWIRADGSVRNLNENNATSG
ncbi:rhombosortase [Abyssibacter sp.]|uniref:rhombosortase n=1 Tax=Abyssibacter sp. TaxID=2320200 RepID=UPI000C467770|nr:rhombosortase [Abyssibacter sp.]MBB85834.1 rhombosortase [Xanthomonadales bacterium]MCK5860287.1 rhombosortase [Abyssibacter sp.]